MSKQIVSIPLTAIERVAVIFGSGRSLAQVKGDADYIINGGFYDMTTGKPVGHLKAGGTVYVKENWSCYGMTWDTGGDIRMDVVPDKGGVNYISGVELLTPGRGPGAALSYPAEVGGARGRSAIALTGDKLLLYCSGDGTADARTPETLRDELVQLGAQSAVMMDSGGSSQCDFQGQTISSSRRVNNYLAVWLKKETGTEPEKEETNMKQYTVIPEVGLRIRQGPGTSYDRIGAYTKGTVVTILEESNGWGRTDKGWVCMDYLEPLVEATETDNGTPIIQDLIPSTKKNRPGGSNPCQYITIHETGNPAPGANAKAHASYLKSTSDSVSWHYTVDDSVIYQHIPDTETAWHATDGANGPGNCTSIGIEICVNQGGDFERAKANATSLVRLLMERHGLTVDKVVQHNHWYAKNCPQTIRETGTWEDFLAMCQGEVPAAADPLTQAVDKLAAAGIINSPDYWKGGTYSTENVQALIIKVAAAI